MSLFCLLTRRYWHLYPHFSKKRKPYVWVFSFPTLKRIFLNKVNPLWTVFHEHDKQSNQQHNTQGKLFETLKQNNTTTVHDTSNKPLLLGEKNETRKENLRKNFSILFEIPLYIKSLRRRLSSFNDEKEHSSMCTF